MKASVWSGYFSTVSAQETILRLKQAGFDYTELTINHVNSLLEQGSAREMGAQLRTYADSIGMTIPQGHLNFSKGLSLDTTDGLKRELELFDAVGITNAVLHFNGGGALSPEAQHARRMEGLLELQSFVKGSPMYICLENLGSVPETHTVQQLLQIIDEAGGENLAICLDTGHLHLVNGRGQAQQSQQEFILTAGRHLRALHITDNNGKNDVHQMPYSARYGVDWPQVTASLRQIGYEGLFNLEILGERNAPEPIKTAKLRFIREMVSYMLAEDFGKA